MIRRALLTACLPLASCSSGASEGDATPTPVALVTLAHADAGGLVDTVTLYGAAEAGPMGSATLSAPVEARVARIAAPVGTRVAAGQLVVALAPGPNARLDLVKANADARAADEAYARQQRLRQDGLVGDSEVEQARAAVATADATRASLSGRVGALNLVAPAAGYVQSIAANPGDLVQPGTAVATIARNGDLRARFGVDPTVARALRPGQPLTITATAGRAAFAVPISSVEPVVDPQTRLASVFVNLPAQAGIGIGETLTANVATGRSGAASVTVPYAALLDDGGQTYVYVVADGVAHRRDVAVGASEGNRVAIARGVAAGDQVVVAGGTGVEDGMKVRTK